LIDVFGFVSDLFDVSGLDVLRAFLDILLIRFLKHRAYSFQQMPGTKPAAWLELDEVCDGVCWGYGWTSGNPLASCYCTPGSINLRIGISPTKYSQFAYSILPLD
jgi:hypothetical protein